MENKFSIPGLFYKYRSLENLERFLSIIIDRKLYGALYSEMNDPMEGYYKYDPRVEKGLMENIVNGKKIGCNVDRTKKSYLEKIIKALDSDIEIVKMHKDNLDYGYIY